MILRQIVCDETDLTLTKEKKVIKPGDVFTIEDEARAKEILAATFKGKPVAELVEEPKENKPEEDKPSKKTTNKKK